MSITINGSGTITGISAGGLPDGSVTAADIESSLDLTGKTVTLPSGTGGKFDSYAIIADQKAAGTNAGTFNNGSWVTRELNTELADTDNIVSITTNQFTLAAGSYLIKASAPAYQVDGHQVRLYNVTDTATAIVGEITYTSTTSGAQIRSALSGRITITESKTFELQHRCTTGRANNGLGNGVDFGEVNLYAMVEIYKEAG